MPLPSPSSNSITITALSPPSAVYTVTGTANNCPSALTVSNLTVLPTITANAGRDTFICIGESINLSGIKSIGGQTYSWTSLTDNSLTTPTSMFTSATPVITSDYTLTVSYNGLCPATDTVKVTVNPTPIVYAGKDTTINIEDAVVLNGFSDEFNYTWLNAATLNCDHCLSPVASPLETTSYTLTATNQFNCTNADTVTVTVIQEYALYVPSAFSPNDDYTNESWKPQGFGIKKIQIYVYDRWGMKLFEAQDLHTPWNGIFKGSIVQQDVYVYKINAESYSGDKISKVGHITVVK